MACRNTAREIYFFGMHVGIEAVLKGKFKIGIKRMLYPVAYWRYPVFPLLLEVLDAGSNATPKKILDIGSPKLLALFLALKRGMEVHATDLQDKEIFEVWAVYHNCFSRKNPTGNYTTEYQDGRNLTYQNNAFDLVFSISAIEHIPDDGDTLVMKEITRVLKKNGIAIIEVPYSIKHYESFVNEDVYERKFSDQPVFFERYYDDESLMNRLLIPSGLRLERKIVIGECISLYGFFEKIPKFLRVFSWSEAIVSAANHYHVTAEQIEADKISDERRAMSITLVLRKP